MTKRQTRKLYREAESAFKDGWIVGTSHTVLELDRYQRAAARCFLRGASPAYQAGYALGQEREAFPLDLPLDVWVKVLAEAQVPR